MIAQVDYFNRAPRVRDHILYIQSSSCSVTSSASIQSVLYSPVQDIDPLPVVYPGVIPYVPYGRILYGLPPTSIVRPASTHLGHPQSINSDPRSRISCDSAHISVRDAIPLPPQAQRGPWRLIAGNSKYYVPNQIRVRLSACIPYCHMVGYRIETGAT